MACKRHQPVHSRGPGACWGKRAGCSAWSLCGIGPGPLSSGWCSGLWCVWQNLSFYHSREQILSSIGIGRGSGGLALTLHPSLCLRGARALLGWPLWPETAVIQFPTVSCCAISQWLSAPPANTALLITLPAVVGPTTLYCGGVSAFFVFFPVTLAGLVRKGSQGLGSITRVSSSPCHVPSFWWSFHPASLEKQ